MPSLLFAPQRMAVTSSRMTMSKMMINPTISCLPFILRQGYVCFQSNSIYIRTHYYTLYSSIVNVLLLQPSGPFRREIDSQQRLPFVLALINVAYVRCPIDNRQCRHFHVRRDGRG